jgi:hypothetical protein
MQHQHSSIQLPITPSVKSKTPFSIVRHILVCLLILPVALACNEQVKQQAMSAQVSSSPIQTPRLKFTNPFVFVYGYDANGVRVSTCGGTWIAPPLDAPADAKGRVLTCLHCILSTSRLQILGADQQLYDVNLLTSWVPSGDLVILSVSGIQAQQTPMAVIAQNPLKKGQPVLLRHGPQGVYREGRTSILSFSYQQGEVVGASGSVYFSGPTFTVSLAIDPGSSGGGVFNQQGELVGVLNMATLTESWGIPIEQLRELERLKPPIRPATFAAFYVAFRRGQQFGIPPLYLLRPE